MALQELAKFHRAYLKLPIIALPVVTEDYNKRAYSGSIVKNTILKLL
jgi:hypothetical protein